MRELSHPCAHSWQDHYPISETDFFVRVHLTLRAELIPIFVRCGHQEHAEALLHSENGIQVSMAVLGEVDYLARGLHRSWRG